MDQLPNCPKCNSEYTYEDGNLLVCPECAYEWTPGSENVNEDELVEVTPNNIRLRKKYLSELDRKRAYRAKNSASE